jgi:UPF0716 family protein affecting phage T7 exclusion
MVMAGVLLILPGVLTDIMGLTLLIPYCRRALRVAFAGWLRHRVTLVTRASTSGQWSHDENTIDAVVVSREDGPHKQHNTVEPQHVPPPASDIE